MELHFPFLGIWYGDRDFEAVRPISRAAIRQSSGAIKNCDFRTRQDGQAQSRPRPLRLVLDIDGRRQVCQIAIWLGTGPNSYVENPLFSAFNYYHVDWLDKGCRLNTLFRDSRSRTDAPPAQSRLPLNGKVCPSGSIELHPDIRRASGRELPLAIRIFFSTCALLGDWSSRRAPGENARY